MHISIWLSSAEDISGFIRHDKFTNAAPFFRGAVRPEIPVLQLSARTPSSIPNLSVDLRVCLTALRSPNSDSIAVPHGSIVIVMYLFR